jgi:predicted nucleic acid-binding protein
VADDLQRRAYGGDSPGSIDSSDVRYRTGPCTDAEVLQEILHRFTAIARRDAIDPAFEAILGVVDVVHSIELDDVQRARRLVKSWDRLSARDAIHVAVMQRHEIGRILSFDAGFDGVEGVVRVST